MSAFTTNSLAELMRVYRIARDSAQGGCPASVFDAIDLAGFALAMWERAEKSEAEAARAEMERDRARADGARLKKELDSVLYDADRVMSILAEHGASILPHLMDDDENPGERLRQAVRNARERGK